MVKLIISSVEFVEYSRPIFFVCVWLNNEVPNCCVAFHIYRVLHRRGRAWTRSWARTQITRWHSNVWQSWTNWKLSTSRIPQRTKLWISGKLSGTRIPTGCLQSTIKWLHTVFGEVSMRTWSILLLLIGNKFERKEDIWMDEIPNGEFGFSRSYLYHE